MIVNDVYIFLARTPEIARELNILFFVTRRLARNVRLFDLQPITLKLCHFVARSEHFEKSMRTVDANISLHRILLVYIYF